MEPDYPAAHSMDTSWFAVDRCGHVAVFDTGEDGAVPDDAPCSYHSLKGNWPFPGELDRSLQAGRIRPGVHQTKKIILYDMNSYDGPRYEVPAVHGLFLLGAGLKSDRARLRGPELRWPWWNEVIPPILGSTDGRDWVEGYLHLDAWTWLHEAPHRCLGCVGSLELDDEQRLEALRIIRFDNDNYGLRPYEKAHDPWNPATLESLRALMGNLIPEAPRFAEFCFRDKKLVQPLQWFPCHYWGMNRSWIDEEGREHVDKDDEET